LIDDFGYLRDGRLCVLLPMTELAGGKVVLGKILDYANQHGLSIQADVFYYHGRVRDSFERLVTDQGDTQTSPPETDSGSSEADGLIDKIHGFGESWDLELRPLKSLPETGPGDVLVNNPPEYSSENVALQVKINVVRADLHTQSRVGSTAELLELCSRPYPVWKRQLDILGASVGLIAGFPVLILAGVAIKLSSRGPVLFSQLRCGQYGKPFVIYKLRTMSHDAEQIKHLLEDLNERDGPAFKIKDDPRVTMVGKLLRATGIDELPQLINVLKGDMALVGPRPLPVVEESECSTWQQRRLDTKPGITCLWQISKSRKMSFDEWMRLDLYYLRKRSLVYDASLLIRTVTAVVLGRVGH